MKLLMLGWELPPHNSGGLGVACYQLCKALASKGADINFVIPYTAEHDATFMRVTAALPQNVSEVLRTGIAYDSYRYLYSDGRVEWLDMFGQQEVYERFVERLVDILEFDVIHAHDWLTFRAALRAKHKSGKPLIVHVHSVERDRAGGDTGNPLVREIESLALMMADRVVAVSRHTKRMISEDYGIPLEKIEVVYNSIDPDTVVPLDDDNAYRYLTSLKAIGYRVVVNVGRLTLQKGLPNLLRAMAAVVRHNPKVVLLIVGSGDQEYELLELAAELGISRNVILTGFQRGKNWRDAYAIGDLFVMPSVSEPFGLTPLEAIGYGTPALISRQSGVAEILLNVLKIDFWDVAEMANQIAAVVGNDSLRDELHTNSYREYAQLNWGDSADKLMELYHRHLMKATA